MYHPTLIGAPPKTSGGFPNSLQHGVEHRAATGVEQGVTWGKQKRGKQRSLNFTPAYPGVWPDPGVTRGYNKRG